MKYRVMMLVCVFGLLPYSVFAGGTPERTTVKNTSVPVNGQAKYVFLFIGDGMAMSQISAAELFSSYASKDGDIIQGVNKLNFTQFPVTGLATTYEATSFITDSASAGTAIASGNKTASGVINMDVTLTQRFKTIAEYAHESGRKVGIVSSVTLNHATPASFYAKVPSRNDSYDIAVQLANSGFEYFGGGLIGNRTGSDKDQPDAVELAKSKGYTYVDTREGFDALRQGAKKVIAVSPTVQDAEALPYEIDRKDGELSLADYTKKAIELLDNTNGFFIMVEGGKVDWACHANDAGAVIHDVLALDAAVKTALDFAARHPDETLIVVTGDHETGGLTIGFAGMGYETRFEKVALQQRSYIAFDSDVLAPYKRATRPEDARLEDMLPAIQESFGIDFKTLSTVQKEQVQLAFDRSMTGGQSRSLGESLSLLYGGYEPLTVKLTQIQNQSAGMGWTSYAHTGVPVPVFVTGANEESFGGYYDNTDIFRKLAGAMGLRIQ